MLSSSLANRYAVALYAIGEEKGTLLELERQLSQINQTILENHELREAYMNPVLPTEAKQRIIEAIFTSPAYDETLISFLKLLADKKRTPYLTLVLEELTDLIDIKRNAVEATVVTAIELNEADQERMKVKLEKQTGKTVRLKAKTDPKIIGGVVLHLGDRIIDGSIRYQLESIRQYLRQGGANANTVIG